MSIINRLGSRIKVKVLVRRDESGKTRNRLDSSVPGQTDGFRAGESCFQPRLRVCGGGERSR
jgi:hypothetical protein